MTSVVWYSNADSGAPVLNGQAGSLVGLLDACLVNGFNIRAISTITVNANVATLTTATNHGYKDDEVVLVEGVTPTALNGRKRVLSRTANTITFAAPGVPNGSGTGGSMSVKVAPAGWEIAFTNTNIRIYRSPNVQGTRMFYRVDDTATTHATVTAAEGYTDIDTPVRAWMSNRFIIKSTAANANAVEWDLVGDDRTFYFRPESGNNGIQHGYGDYTPYRPNNAYAAFANGHNVSAINSASNTSAHSLNAYTAPRTGVQQLLVARDPTALQSGRWASLASTLPVASAISNSNNPASATTVFSGCGTQQAYNTIAANASLLTLPFPDLSGGGLILARALVSGVSDSSLYGQMRGLFFSPQDISSLTSRQIFDASGEFSGRKVLVLEQVRINGITGPWLTNSSGDYGSRLLFDITGPWG